MWCIKAIFSYLEIPFISFCMQFGKNLVDIIKPLCSTYHDRFIACSGYQIEKVHAFYDFLLNVVLFTLQR